MTTAAAKTISDLRDRGGLSGVDLANVTDVSKATVRVSDRTDVNWPAWRERQS